jgi:hypothetical protein
MMRQRRTAAARCLAALAALALCAPTGVQAQAGADAPTKLWRTYPVDPHGGRAPIRVGKAVGTQRDQDVARGTNEGSEGGASASEPVKEGVRLPATLLLAAVGLTIVLSSLVMVLALGRRFIASSGPSPMLFAANSAARPFARGARGRLAVRRRLRRPRQLQKPKAAPGEVEATPSVVRNLEDAATAARDARQEPDGPSLTEGARPSTGEHALGYGARVEDPLEGSDRVRRPEEAGKGQALDPSASGSLVSDVEALREKVCSGEPEKELAQMDADALKRKARWADAADPLDDTTRALLAAEKQYPATEADVLRDKLRGTSTSNKAVEPFARDPVPGRAKRAAAEHAHETTPASTLGPEALQEPDAPPRQLRHRARPRDLRAWRGRILLAALVSLLSVTLGLGIALLLS